jgi:hypothetical protein
MDIRQIAITDSIVTAVKMLNAEADISKYTKLKGEQGFPLIRLIDLDKKTKPIIIKPIKNMGKKIDGVMVQLYEIIDGRHRVSYAIASGFTTIGVEIN